MHALVFMLICLPLAAPPAGTMKAAVPVERVFGPEHPGGHYKHPASITQLANGDLYLACYTGFEEANILARPAGEYNSPHEPDPQTNSIYSWGLP